MSRRRPRAFQPWAGPVATVLAATVLVATVGCDAAPTDQPGAGGIPALSASAGSSPAPRPTPSTSPPPTATLLAVGDVGDCRPGGDRGRATARLAGRLGGPVLLLGDIAYPDGTRADYARCFWPAWRPLRGRVHAVIGNHDDRSRATFFAQWPHAGTSRRPWYAFDAGPWRVLVVEGNCTVVSCAAGAAQIRWLDRQLAATPGCALLAIHQPRFSSDDEHGDDRTIDAIWRVAVRGGVDLVVAGHAHDYERIGPVAVSGRPDPDGPVLLVAGTGGTRLRGFARVTAASRVRIDDTFGLLRLTLAVDRWESAFHAAPSGEVRDHASGRCR